ncbi:MAG: hypothetical protein IRY94_03015, partial [Rhodospirillaceae bacterium]|nr:hypothetical protein [Rhodospirillaceae bacterium]
MLPLVADLRRLPTLLVGEGPQTARRLRLLRLAGSEPALFAPSPAPALRAVLGSARAVRRLPDTGEIAAARLLLVGDFAATAVDVAALAAGGPPAPPPRG